MFLQFFLIKVIKIYDINFFMQRFRNQETIMSNVIEAKAIFWRIWTSRNLLHETLIRFEFYCFHIIWTVFSEIEVLCGLLLVQAFARFLFFRMDFYGVCWEVKGTVKVLKLHRNLNCFDPKFLEALWKKLNGNFTTTWISVNFLRCKSFRIFFLEPFLSSLHFKFSSKRTNFFIGLMVRFPYI